MSSRWRSLASLAWRESRTTRRRLFLAAASITIGVAALVAIDSFAANVTRSVREQSRTILGGDVALASRRPFPAPVVAAVDSIAAAGHVVARETTFPAMAVLPRTGATRLVQVRAVSDSYPLYGGITTNPAGRWQSVRSDAAAVVDPGLLVALDARVGDTISIGLGRFLVAATIRDAPGVPEIAQMIGPRVYIPERYTAETQLLVIGSTASYEMMLRAGPRADGDALGKQVKNRFRGTDVRVRTAEEAESGLTEAIASLREFVGIVGMVALLLGGLGVASGVHAFVMRKIDTVAILRCLGATSRQVLAMYVAQAAAMGLAGAAIGAVLGVMVQFLIPRFINDFLPIDVAVRAEPRAIAIGLAVGAWVALIFALRPLLGLKGVSPLQTLRRDTDTGILRRTWRDIPNAMVTLAIVGSVLAIAFLRATRPRAAIGIALGTAIAIGALLASAALLSWLARRFMRPRWPYVVRQGLSNLYRPGNQTRPVVLALGFGAFLVSTLILIQASLLKRFDLAANVSGANIVFFDVQADQAPGLDTLVRAADQRVLQLVPIVTMRIAAVKGRPVSAILADSGRGRSGGRRWALSWEFRSTYRDTVTTSEKIVAGRWFSAGATHGDTTELSLEEDIAGDLGVGVGDLITWTVGGSELVSRVTSLRRVSWARFETNFFAVFPSSALRAAPKQFVLVGRTAGTAETARLQRAVVARYPNISSIDLTLIRRTIDTIVARVTTAIRFLAILSLAMGVPVMLSVVAATRRDRIRESVLLKTLGATRATIARVLATEYVALGLLGSLTGVLLAGGAAWALTRYVMDVPFALAFGGPALIAVAMTALTTAIGILGAREVFRRTAMDALRESY